METIQDDTPIEETDFVVFDTETTGTSPLDSLLELGAVKMRGFKVVDTFRTLIRPTTPISSRAFSVHGISEEMVRHAPRAATALQEFGEFCQDSVLVAHNAPFDLKIVSVHLQRLEKPLLENPVLDTKRVSRKHFPHDGNPTLDNLCRVWGSPFEGRHRALEDARHTAFVMSRMAYKMGIDPGTPIRNLLDLWGPPLFMRKFSLYHALLSTSPSILEKVERLKAAIEHGRPVSYTYLKGGEQKCVMKEVMPKTIFSPGDRVYLEVSNSHNQHRSWVCRLDWIIQIEEV